MEVWRAQLKQANTLQRRIRARDRHFCQVPGCSRAAVHAHHIKLRSHGGSDDPSNQISLCAAHHLYGIHGGRMRVTGTAPDNLAWEFGLRRSYVAAAWTTDSLDGPASGVQGLAQSRRGEICAGRNGTRPRTAAAMLTSLGFEHVWNMKGGMLDWNVERLPIER